jgi:cytochrome d ubiquinol oxidase subunit I
MDALTLARMQFATTTIYHFFFVPLSIGLGFMVALMETRYVMTKNETYKKMAQFWGRLFIINAAVGIVTGIVQEFQFGMNWSEYSRFVGDIFGAPLAIETLLAFFLESTFLGIWIFGWDKLNRFVHLACIWLVVFGSLMSAFWILVANSFMQKPVGYTINNGRAEMDNFLDLLTNPNLWAQFPHVLMAGIVTGAFFVMGISAINLLKKRGDADFFRRSLQMGLVVAMFASVLVAVAGDRQGKHTAQVNPMKMAAAEALWETEQSAGWSLISFYDENARKEIFSIKIPGVLSFIIHDDFNKPVKGINEVQKEMEAKYGPGNYVPPVTIVYWAFRGMVGSGGLMILISLLGMALLWRRKLMTSRWYLRILAFAIVLPYIANICGWVVAEVGRQPWAVVGLLRTESAVSPNVSVPMLALTLACFVVLYVFLAIVDIYLLRKFSRGTEIGQPVHEEEHDELKLVSAY